MCPIKGLSETVRIPRLGKIHLGVKVPNKSNPGKVHPEATDYFVLPPEVAPVLARLVGYTGKIEDFKPRELPVMIPLDDEEFWAATYYRRYNITHGLVCKGDGETCRRKIDMETGATISRDTKGKVEWRDGLPCHGRDCIDYKAKKCQEVMNLQFLMPDVPGLGVWQVDTGSINSIININSTAKLLRLQYKRVWGIPLSLTLEPKEVNNPDDGKKKTVHVLNLRMRGTLNEVAQLLSRNVAGLLSPVPVPPDEEEAPMDTADAEPPNGKSAPIEVKGKVLPMSDEDARKLWGDGQQVKPPAEAAATTAKVEPPAPAATGTKETQAKTEAPAKRKSFIEVDWVTEQLKFLQGKKLKMWSDKTVLDYINSVYQVKGESIDEVIPFLNKEQAAEFYQRVEDAVKMA